MIIFGFANKNIRGHFSIFVIPWIGSSIRLIKRNLIRKLANGVGKDNSEMVINLTNIIIIHGA